MFDYPIPENRHMIFSHTAFVLVFATITLMSIGGARAADPGPVDKDASEQFTKTDSGLKYRIRRKSDGEKPKRANTVTVHYRGWLDDGKEFDSSYKRNDPATFPLNRVIPGWTEGVQLVGKGGMIELEIPSELGYGAAGSPGAIPPNARLHFLVELIDIK
jgi:FKBP-type peptidyl-prolyl cis-trans isomerase